MIVSGGQQRVSAMHIHVSTLAQTLSSVQFSHSVMWLSVTPWSTAHQASLSITNSRSLLKLMSIASVMPSNQLILSCPLLLLPSIFPSIRIFSNESVLHIRWPRYWSFSFSISPSDEYSGLISFRMDWLDLLAVQRTLKSLLQHHSSKSSVLWHSAFFILQLLYPYMTTGKTPNSPPYCIAQGTLLSVMWQPGWEGSLFSFLNNRLSPQGTPTKALPPPL